MDGIVDGLLVVYVTCMFCTAGKHMIGIAPALIGFFGICQTDVPLPVPLLIGGGQVGHRALVHLRYNGEQYSMTSGSNTLVTIACSRARALHLHTQSQQARLPASLLEHPK